MAPRLGWMKTPFLAFLFAAAGPLPWFLLAGFCCIPPASAATISPSDMLEAGIYSEETKGDIDAAMELYQQVIADAQANAGLAAQAQYRLGICHHKKKDYAAATAAFEKLVREYPEEKALVAAASDYLANGAALQPVPWADGEDLIYTIRTAAGLELGVGRYAVRAGERDGRKTWIMRNHVVVSGVEQWNRLEVEQASLRPIHNTWKHTLVGKIEVAYSAGAAEITTSPAGETKQAELAGVVYDNDEAVQLIRRLPLAPGYGTTISIFSGLLAQAVPVKLSVSGPEEVTVPAGTFECFKVDLTSLQQTFWYTADRHRHPVKFNAGGVISVLESIGQFAASPSMLTDTSHQFSVSAPAGWLTFRKRDTQKRTEFYLADVDGHGQVRVKVQDVSDWKPEDAGSARAYAEHELRQGAKYVNEQTTRDGSWAETTLAGEPAVSVVYDFAQQKLRLAAYATFAIVDGKGVEVTAFVAPDAVDAFRPKLDAIAATYVSQPRAN